MEEESHGMDEHRSNADGQLLTSLRVELAFGV